jgi:uncharacterized membrane protein YfcA
VTLTQAFILLGAGLLGGLVSTVASVASVVSYPILLALGLPPLAANVTNTVALLFTGAGSVLGSRPELAGQRSRVLRLCAVTAAGGATGAAILLLAPASAFSVVVPVLIGGASVVLIVQPRLRSLSPTPGAERSWGRYAVVFAVSVYTGYFGAAGGVLVLAVLCTMLIEPLVRINAIKNAMTGAANGVAAILFAVFAPVHWSYVPLLAVGFLVGGFVGPKVIRHLPVGPLRIFIAVAGIGLAVKLGWSAYR